MKEIQNIPCSNILNKINELQVVNKTDEIFL